MQGNEKVIDYLNRALRGALTRMNQSWMHGHLQAGWGLGRLSARTLAAKASAAAQADALITRLVLLQGAPRMDRLDDLHTGATVRATLEGDLAAAKTARLLFQEAAQYCRSVGDIPSATMLEDMMGAEETRLNDLEIQIGLFDQIGEAGFVQMNAAPASAADL